MANENIEPIQFVPGEGSPVIVGHRDKAERIREAMLDLQLVIDGCEGKPQERLVDLSGSLARHCSIFLRKMVLGDSRTPPLLDLELCQSAGLSFNRIRRIPGNRRPLTLVPVSGTAGYMQLTKLNDETLEPEANYIIRIGAHQLQFDVEWPLPGMADWLVQPTPEDAWKIQPEGLFETDSNKPLACDEWLGQQLVMVNDRGVTLRDVILAIVNTEAAHSPPIDRLMLVQGVEDKARFRVAKDSEIHILSYITLCGLRYSHAIAIETAFYLYRQLSINEAIKSPEGAGPIMQWSLFPPDVFATDQRWLCFDGGLAIALGGRDQSICFRVRAPR